MASNLQGTTTVVEGPHGELSRGVRFQGEPLGSKAEGSPSGVKYSGVLLHKCLYSDAVLYLASCGEHVTSSWPHVNPGVTCADAFNACINV